MAVELIPSSTYKLRAPNNISEHAIYFTIGGYPHPVWLFVNCKAMDSFQWISALMTSYCGRLHHPGGVEDIINEMKSTFAPGGRYIVPDGTGREVNSIVHHLGLTLEAHLNAH